MKRRLVFLLLLNTFVIGTALAGDDVPGWLTQAASVKTPAYEKDVPAVVLRNDQQVTYGADGKLTVVRTYAVRILLREGRREAVAIAPYLVSTGKIREMTGWLIRADGTTKRYDKNSVIDVIASTDDVYNESRRKVINGSDEADTGAVFGYQVVSEERPISTQDEWFFQDELPTLSSSYTLTVPDGWKTSSITFNHSDIQPQVNGNTSIWRLDSMSPISYEPDSPSFQNMAPRLMVNYFPANGGGTGFNSFSTWTDISRWLSSKHDAQVIIDDTVAGKARELTLNSRTELERIQAIGTFVSNIQYIAIDIGVGYGNGMIPRSSSLVLQRGYGDCKDKANLMRAMLKSLGIEAYPIAIYSGDPTFVRQEWASASQFNHCIIAIKVSDATQAATVIDQPKLGRLMIFDATDPFTPVGDLPQHEQGSWALLLAGENGGLVKMPVTPPGTNKLERQTELTLDTNGSLSGVIRERFAGQPAVFARGEKRSLSPPDYNKMIERWVVGSISSARVSKITPVDKIAEGRFDLDVELNAPAYAQIMQERLMVFKPAVVSRLNSLWLTDPTRTHPIILRSNSFTETSTIKLPAGFAVDEMPDPIKLETSFGKYSISYVVKDGSLVFTRSMVLNSEEIPADKYAMVKDFFVKIRNAEQAPVVLVKK
jgi:hypothetical protein